MTDKSDIKSKIKDIQMNTLLTNSEKNIQIQKLMNTSVNIEKKIVVKCEHYPSKKCDNFYFSCCNIFTHCLRCHNEIDDTHKPILKNIRCKKCKLLQVLSNKCINNDCNIIFSKNYCEICSIWTEKSIVHCEKCGICRVGEKDKLFHCDNCEICFDITIKDSHKCVTKSYRDQTCSYCLESIHNSQNESLSIQCGHIVHKKCLDDAYKSNIYKCALCRKSMYKMNWSYLKYLINMQHMPEEDILVGDIVSCHKFSNLKFNVEEIINSDKIIIYKGFFQDWKINNKNITGFFNGESLKKDPKKVNVFCNDCEIKSLTLFHYLGNECINCGGFNTNIL
jgi:RING finger/CHY zinc finger protein 1